PPALPRSEALGRAAGDGVPGTRSDLLTFAVQQTPRCRGEGRSWTNAYPTAVPPKQYQPLPRLSRATWPSPTGLENAPTGARDVATGRELSVRMDRLLLEGMTFFGRHGVLPAERELGARFRVDVVIEADLAAAGRSDRLEDTVDYVRAYSVVREV